MESEIYLLDSSLWISALRKDPPLPLRERVEHLLRDNVVAITAIIKVELLGGTRTDMEFKRLHKRLDSLIQLEIDTPRWEGTARLAFDLRRQGVTVPYTDILIAETAIHYKARLLHIDKHFDLIAEKTSLLSEYLS